VRFDDKLDTVFAQPADDEAGIAVAWAQIVDILAQDRGLIDPGKRATALERLANWRGRIAVERRKASALSLSGRALPADIVALFGRDVPHVAAPILSSVVLDDDGWATVIPALMPASRALVRERRDLSPQTQRMLAGFGLSDFGLPAAQHAEESIAADPTSTQIKDLVARIEAFRKEREDGLGREQPVAIEDAPDHFRFETGADGIVNWVDGAPRGAIIGIEIATMAEIGAHGVDGHAAGAFRRRTPFRNARMAVPGAGAVAGEWLISGLPCFNEADGRFFGYRCTARRLQHDERPVAQNLVLFGNALPADSVRQLIHELRTPLNAIRGFAEMIGGQLLGPVSAAYRQKAKGIVDEASKLLSLFEDLDSAAKLERGQDEARPGATCDFGEVIHVIASDFVGMTNDRQVRLRLAAASNLPEVAVEKVTVQRIASRLLGAVIGLSSVGETITATLAEQKDNILFTIDRPLSLAGQTERDLLDPSYGPQGEWPDAPALGLGFALRLIGSTARAAGGKLLIAEDRFSLFLPVANGTADTTKERL
jgi:signal transduction histidine kinase